MEAYIITYVAATRFGVTPATPRLPFTRTLVGSQHDFGDAVKPLDYNRGDMLNQLDGKKNLLRLRQARARNTYYCRICSSIIKPGQTYFRDEPHPLARWHRGVEPGHLCSKCVLGSDSASVIRNPPYPCTPESQQLRLTFGEEAVVHRTLARVVDVTPLILTRMKYTR
jgi:hypothetical protein